MMVSTINRSLQLGEVALCRVNMSIPTDVFALTMSNPTLTQLPLSSLDIFRP